MGRLFFFFNDTATTEIYTLSLHDALPIFGLKPQGRKKLQAAEPAVPTAPRQAACSKPVLALAPGLPGPLAFQTSRRPSARIRPSANRLRCSLTSISRRSPREPLLGLRRPRASRPTVVLPPPRLLPRSPGRPG